MAKTIADLKAAWKALADDNTRTYGRWNSSTGNGKWNVPSGKESYPPSFDCGLALTWGIYKACGWSWNSGTECAYKGYIWPDNEGTSNHEWFLVSLLGAKKYKYSDIGYAGLKNGDILDSKSHVWAMYDKSRNQIFEANDGYSSGAGSISIHNWIDYGPVWVYRLPWKEESAIRDGLQDKADSNGKWGYYKDGKVDTSVTTVAENANGWWYVKDGYVDFSFNGFASNSNGDWYCEKGKVTFKTNDIIEGTVKGVKAWWYVVNSKVTYNKITVAHNKNGWWYIGKDGKVDFNFNGIASNTNGIWYINNGKVDFSVNGTKTVNAEFKGGKLIV